MTRFCRDCRHVVPSISQTSQADALYFATCMALQAPNIVTGETERTYCMTARMIGAMCGPDANLWEPIEVDEEDAA